MNKRLVRIGDLTIKDGGRMHVINADGFSQQVGVKYLDDHHFEMSDIYGQFGTCGAHIWHVTEYEMFCKKYGVLLDPVMKNKSFLHL